MRGDRLEQDVREFVARLAARAPEGWTGFESAVKAGPGGPECDGWWAVPGGGLPWTGEATGAGELLAAIAAERGWHSAELTVQGRRGGAFGFTAEPGTVRSGDTVVLDPGYVHPLPEESTPGSVLPPAGDPDRVEGIPADGS